jgi:ComEC/Rec2-related protein
MTTTITVYELWASARKKTELLARSSLDRRCIWIIEFPRWISPTIGSIYSLDSRWKWKSEYHPIYYKYSGELFLIYKEKPGLIEYLRIMALWWIEKRFQAETAGLIAGILFGRDDYLDEYTYDIFRTTWLAHVIVASGGNISLVSGFILSCMRYISRRRWILFLCVSLGVWIYGSIAGWGSPLIRWASMSLASIWLLYFGYRASALVLLLTWMVYYITSHIQEPQVFLSVALSAGAIGGLICFWDIWKWGVWKEYPTLTNTIAALFGTLPVFLYTMNTLSLHAILFNILFLPLLPIIYFFSSMSLFFSYKTLGEIIFTGGTEGIFSFFMTFALPTLEFLPWNILLQPEPSRAIACVWITILCIWSLKVTIKTQ